MSTKSTDVISADYLKVTDLDNFFNIYKDNRNRYFYNLNAGVYFNINENLLQTYICDYDMHWPLISYKLYGTTRLAWVLMDINKVGIKDLFKIQTAGTKIKYLDKTNIKTIIENINDY